MSSRSLHWIEQTDFVVRFARCDSLAQPLRIDHLEEISRSAPEAVAEAARRLAPAADGVVIAALRPRLERLDVAAVGDTKSDRPLTAAELFLRAVAPGATSPHWITGADAATGRAAKSARWVFAGTSSEVYEQSLAAVAELGWKPTQCTSGVLATAGALAATVDGPTLLLEIGELQSHALLISRAGIVGATTLTLNRDRIAEAIQAELGMKFRAAAGQLFFNRDYDFTDIAANLGRRYAETLKPELGRFLSAQPAPVALYCPTLAVSQQWLAAALAHELGVSVFAPDLKTWCAGASVTLGDTLAQAPLSPSWLGLVHALADRAAAGTAAAAWQPEWGLLSAKPAATAPAPAPAPAKPAPVAPAQPRPAATAAAPAPAKSAPAAKPVPAAAPAKQAANQKPATPAPVTSPAASTPVAKPAATPASSPAPAATESSVSYDKPTRSKGGSQKRVLMIAGAVIVAAIAFFFIQQQRDESERLAKQKKDAEQRLQAEQEKVRLAEQQARAIEEARKKTEADYAQKLALEESRRQQAEKEAQTQAAARLANARGTLVIVTEPAGATVAVGDLPPRTSPATFTDIRIGQYNVVISRPHFDPARLSVDVKENETTTPEKVVLQSAVGAIEIASDVPGVSYEVHPAKMLMVDPAARRSGVAPATLQDLDPGEYAVTFTRPGWAPHTETVQVTRGGTARVAWNVPTGHVKLTSEPSGATVKRKGVALGVTPLDLNDEAPGAVAFEVSRDDYDRPVTVTGDVDRGQTLELVARFAAEDRVYREGEFERKPTPISDKPIKVPYYLLLEKPRVELELTVNRDGVPHNINVIRATNKDLEKYCQDALEKARYKPATFQGQPVNARIKVVLTSFSAAE